MAHSNFKTLFFPFAFVITAVHGASLYNVIESLEKNGPRRCEAPTCDKDFMHATFNYFLTACRQGGCEKDFVLRVTPFAHGHIQQYCVLTEWFRSPYWSVLVQADLIPQGARMVLVMVPRSTKTEHETFKRPYVFSEVIPRNELYIINQFVKKYCGVTV